MIICIESLYPNQSCRCEDSNDNDADDDDDDDVSISELSIKLL